MSVGELEQESLMNVVSQLGGVKGESIAHTAANTINQNRRRGKIENTENGEGGLRKMNAFHLNKQQSFFPLFFHACYVIICYTFFLLAALFLSE